MLPRTSCPQKPTAVYHCHQGISATLVTPACLMLQQPVHFMQNWHVQQELASKNRGVMRWAPHKGDARAPGTRAAR